MDGGDKKQGRVRFFFAGDAVGLVVELGHGGFLGVIQSQKVLTWQSKSYLIFIVKHFVHKKDVFCRKKECTGIKSGFQAQKSRYESGLSWANG